MSRIVPFVALLILAALAFACEDEGPDDCHAVDITKAECLDRGKCAFFPTFFAYTDDQGCLLGDSRTWFTGRNLGLGVCADAVEPPELIDNYNPTQYFCRELAPNLHLVIDVTARYDARLGAGWTPCYYEDAWMFSNLERPYYFSGNCRPTCGDGIIDPGESCEPSLPLPFETCEAAGEQLERDWVGGEPVCTGCTLYFYHCEAAP
jgi:hypothetical protein